MPDAVAITTGGVATDTRTRRSPPTFRPGVLALSALSVCALAALVLWSLDGWSYYRSPLVERGHLATHRVLRPSGTAGVLFGISGFVLMLVPVFYAARKRLRLLRSAGSMTSWLNVHVFAGIVGPACVTFHTAFKFGGLVSVAYWSMVSVVLSGFVGRYLYVRIPRNLRGIEVTAAELEQRAATLGRAIADAEPPPALLDALDAFERRAAASDRSASVLGLFAGEWQMRRSLAAMRRTVAIPARGGEAIAQAFTLIAERETLLRRAAYLQKAKRLFDLWHVFHMPLVYVMFAIVVAHVALVVYLGYGPFGR